MLYYISLFALLFSSFCEGIPFEGHHIVHDNKNIEIFLDYHIPPQDAIFDTIQFSFNSPAVEITEWSSTQPAKMVFDIHHTQEQRGFTGEGSFIIKGNLFNEPLPEGVQLFMHYTQKQLELPQEFVYSINTSETSPKFDSLPSHRKHKQSLPNEAKVSLVKSFLNYISSLLSLLKNWISDLFLKTESPFIRLGLVYILGLFMSLTPCIYPMIPVTIGILQTTAGSSFLRNFLLACSYTLGIAMTFATLGFLAATGSGQFGALLGNFYFVLFLVLFFGYLALSMLGLYEMHIPRFMQSSGSYKSNGSYFSAFVFGAISGSVASPCVSPGLFTLLGIVATMGSKFLGFIYLFLFGLGLGTPLLIVGTFSNALQMAPRAGLWMIEVKKVFGVIMLGMCCYYLSNVIEWYILLWIMAIILVCLGIFFVGSIKPFHKTGMKWYKYITGTAFIIGALIIAYHATKETWFTQATALHTISYSQAREEALVENKLMLVDFGARWCSACKELEDLFLHNAYVLNKLQKEFIVVKVDCTNPNEEVSAALQKQFNITGLPAVLVIEPRSEQVLYKGSSELLSLSLDEFVATISDSQNSLN